MRRAWRCRRRSGPVARTRTDPARDGGRGRRSGRTTSPSRTRRRCRATSRADRGAWSSGGRSRGTWRASYPSSPACRCAASRDSRSGACATRAICAARRTFLGDFCAARRVLLSAAMSNRILLLPLLLVTACAAELSGGIDDELARADLDEVTSELRAERVAPFWDVIGYGCP